MPSSMKGESEKEETKAWRKSGSRGQAVQKD